MTEDYQSTPIVEVGKWFILIEKILSLFLNNRGTFQRHICLMSATREQLGRRRSPELDLVAVREQAARRSPRSEQHQAATTKGMGFLNTYPYPTFSWTFFHTLMQ